MFENCRQVVNKILTLYFFMFVYLQQGFSGFDQKFSPTYCYKKNIKSGFSPYYKQAGLGTLNTTWELMKKNSYTKINA